MTQQNIYLVQGSTGEYSDHMEWNVAAYFDKEQAERHRDLAQTWSKCDFIGGTQLGYEERDEMFHNSPFDPNIRIDYTGVRYYVDVVPLVNHPAEFVELYGKKEVTP